MSESVVTGVGPNEMIAVSDQVTMASVGGEAVVLHLGSGAYYGLNEVAARAFELASTPRPFKKLVAAIVDEYDVEPAQAERDLAALLVALEQEGLVTIGKQAAR